MGSVKSEDPMIGTFDTVPACDRWTDGHLDYS